jgi:hypothetical protein
MVFGEREKTKMDQKIFFILTNRKQSVRNQNREKQEKVEGEDSN